MKQHILYRILTVAFGICAIALAVLAVISLIPTTANEGLTVKETLRVSSSALEKDSAKYVSQIQGILINESDKTITVDALKFKVSDGQKEKEIVLDGFTLPARVSHNVMHEWEDAYYFSRVNSVTAVIDGESVPLANATAEMPFDFGTVVLLALSAVFVLVAIHFGKQCYYLVQEEQIKKRME